jgi:CRP-like cAMP-binding protein
MRKNPFHARLRRLALFADLTAAELDRVERVVTQLSVHAGKVLMREGSVASEMVIGLDGALAVSCGDEHVAELTAGDFVGEVGILNRTARTGTVTALADADLLHIDARAFGGLLEAVPALAERVLPVAIARAMASVHRTNDARFAVAS